MNSDKLQLNNDYKSTYNFGYNKARFIKLLHHNDKYEADTSETPANNILLVSVDTLVMNQLKLYKSVTNLKLK